MGKLGARVYLNILFIYDYFKWKVIKHIHVVNSRRKNDESDLI